MEGFSEQLFILNDLLSQLLAVLGAATHQPLLHHRPDVLHHRQPLGLLLQTLQTQQQGSSQTNSTVTPDPDTQTEQANRGFGKSISGLL